MSAPFEQSREQESHLFAESVQRGVDLALRRIEQEFELAANPENNFDFHNRQHTRGVMRRTQRILEALRQADPTIVSERDVLLGQFAASGHDLVQAWQPKESVGRFGPERTRQRAIGHNEAASFTAQAEYMDQVNNEAGTEVFTPQDRAIVEQAIMVTVPTWEPHLKTVVQRDLTSESHPVVWAVAMSDLGTAGMEEPETFLHDSDSLYREMNLDLAELLPVAKSLPPEQQEQLRQRMLQWTNGQIDYCIGRKKAFNNEVRYLPESGQKAVGELFQYFDATIQHLGQVYEQRKHMTVAQLAVDMGYNEQSA